MEFIGDENQAAPALNEITLSMTAAHRVFDRIVENIELLLRHDRIHGDLSAYNVLYWDGKEVLIDLPQVVDASRRPDAFDLLARDVHHICKHFQRYIEGIDPSAILSRLVSEYSTMPTVSLGRNLPTRLTHLTDSNCPRPSGGISKVRTRC